MGISIAYPSDWEIDKYSEQDDGRLALRSTKVSSNFVSITVGENSDMLTSQGDVLVYLAELSEHNVEAGYWRSFEPPKRIEVKNYLAASVRAIAIYHPMVPKLIEGTSPPQEAEVETFIIIDGQRMAWIYVVWGDSQTDEIVKSFAFTR